MATPANPYVLPSDTSDHPLTSFLVLSNPVLDAESRLGDCFQITSLPLAGPIPLASSFRRILDGLACSFVCDGEAAVLARGQLQGVAGVGAGQICDTGSGHVVGGVAVLGGVELPEVAFAAGDAGRGFDDGPRGHGGAFMAAVVHDGDAWREGVDEGRTAAAVHAVVADDEDVHPAELVDRAHQQDVPWPR